ncbi:hypothetical protein [Undibacterium oligocarboniphilum]|uniref:P-type conjugative transfer protein TrbJ n=1 Tax=Undibacterium oligocarboniphilum TaxID=666702 RepID=A0A850QEW4_9BURK|nr:hypothetical protein [Undibacterium oligocarboniphilum]MBC3871412.1 hypothetical protein [Undibacterium oligocarboniphilum]NVO79012.1 hypothetical protein [Undibacterium oligocarboniphilum]
MKTNKTFSLGIKTLVLMLSLSAYSNAFALVVWDPSNWVQNNISAMTAVKNELNTYRSYINQLVQLKHSIQNIREMGPEGIAARALGVENELRAMRELKSASQQLYATLQSNGDYVTGIQRMVNVSAMTSEAWLAREQKLIRQRDANATYLMKQGESLTKTIEQAQKNRDKVLSDNAIEGGMLETAQKTNVLLGDLGAMQGAMLMTMKANTEVTSANQVLKNNEDASKSDEAKKWVQERVKAQDSSLKYD